MSESHLQAIKDANKRRRENNANAKVMHSNRLED